MTGVQRGSLPFYAQTGVYTCVWVEQCEGFRVLTSTMLVQPSWYLLMLIPAGVHKVGVYSAEVLQFGSVYRSRRRFGTWKCLYLEGSTRRGYIDRKSVVYKKSVDLGGQRLIQTKPKTH